MSLLEVRDLKMTFRTGSVGARRNVQAVAGVDFTIDENETLGIVGESGCGKSTLARMLARLIRPTAGEIVLNGLPAGTTKSKAFRRDVQMVFQDPYASLNPRMTVGELLAEPFLVHERKRRSQSQGDVVALLESVGLAPDHRQRYPHEFSGGQRQRIGIARAMALRPKLIIFDEPVSALDVSIQAGVINLLQDRQAELGLAYAFIAHDLSVVRQVSHRVAVMYLGRIVEIGPVDELYSRPHHPYTQALLSAVPIPDPIAERTRERIILVGDVPSPADPPSGCRFRTRCWKATDLCSEVEPALQPSVGVSHVACHYPD